MFDASGLRRDLVFWGLTYAGALLVVVALVVLG